MTRCLVIIRLSVNVMILPELLLGILVLLVPILDPQHDRK